jgi:hypothetical protein
LSSSSIAMGVIGMAPSGGGEIVSDLSLKIRS